MDVRKYRRLQIVGVAFTVTVALLGMVVVPVTGTGNSEKHFLWATKGRKNTVYLLGSIHILRKDSYPLPSAIEKVYHCCNHIVFETDPDGANDPSVQDMMMRRSLYPKGQVLKDNISDQTHQMLQKKLLASEIPIDTFERFRPWFVAINVANAELQRMGFDADIGIERYFFNRARKDNKKFIFLESMQYQINLFAGLSKNKQEALLSQVLKEMDIIESEFQEMIASWKHGDSETFSSIIKKGFDDYPEMYDRLITQRNKRWIQQIEKLMQKDQDVLVIVGAGHLAGKGSLVDLLEKRGHQIRQL